MKFQHSHTEELSGLLLKTSGEENRRIRRLVLIGCLINASLMVLKLTVGYYGHSEALMADGYHSLNDFAADLIMLLFIGISFRKPDSRYSYGYGRYETFSTFLISIFLFFVAVHITLESIDSIRSYAEGEVLPQPDIWTVVVVIVSMCSKEFLFRFYRHGSIITGVKALLTNAWHHRSDAMASVATLIGVSFAHFFGEGWRILDPVASLILVVFIIIASTRMLIPAFRELMDRSCGTKESLEVKMTVASTPGVRKIYEIKSRMNGHYHIFDITIGVRPNMSVEDASVIASEIEERLKKEWGDRIMVGVRTLPCREIC